MEIKHSLLANATPSQVKLVNNGTQIVIETGVITFHLINIELGEEKIARERILKTEKMIKGEIYVSEKEAIVQYETFTLKQMLELEKSQVVIQIHNKETAQKLRTYIEVACNRKTIVEKTDSEREKKTLYLSYSKILREVIEQEKRIKEKKWDRVSKNRDALYEKIELRNNQTQWKTEGTKRIIIVKKENKVENVTVSNACENKRETKITQDYLENDERMQLFIERSLHQLEMESDHFKLAFLLDNVLLMNELQIDGETKTAQKIQSFEKIKKHFVTSEAKDIMERILKDGENIGQILKNIKIIIQKMKQEAIGESEEANERQIKSVSNSHFTKEHRKEKRINKRKI